MPENQFFFEPLALERPERPEFERALGQLVIAWVGAEGALYVVLVKYAGVSDAIARSAFSGLRARTVGDAIKNIAHNVGMSSERLGDLTDVLEQLNAINTIRDRLMHHASFDSGWDVHERSLVVTNAKRVNRQGAAHFEKVTAAALDGMVHDLHLICSRLAAHLGDHFRAYQETPGVRDTWLYKPSQLHSHDRKGRESRQKPPRPRKSSPP